MHSVDLMALCCLLLLHRLPAEVVSEIVCEEPFWASAIMAYLIIYDYHLVLNHTQNVLSEFIVGKKVITIAKARSSITSGMARA